MHTRATRAFGRFSAPVGALARQLDSGSFGETTSFGHFTWTVELDAIEPRPDGTAEVTITVTKGGENPGGGNSWAGETFVNGELVTENPDGWITGRGSQTKSVVVEAEPGDAIRVRVESEGSTSVSGRVPQLPPGEIVATDLTVEPASVPAGEPVTVTVAAENVGGQATSRSITVTAGGAPVGSVAFELAPGGTDSGVVTFSPAAAGEFPIAADGATATLTVEEPPAPEPEPEPAPEPEPEPAPAPAEIVVTGLEAPAEATVDQPASLTVSARNEGEQAGSRGVTVTAGGAEVSTVTFDLNPGEAASRTLTWIPAGTGRVEIAAGGREDSVLVREVESAPGAPVEGGAGAGAAVGLGAAALLAVVLLAR